MFNYSQNQGQHHFVSRLWNFCNFTVRIFCLWLMKIRNHVRKSQSGEILLRNVFYQLVPFIQHFKQRCKDWNLILLRIIQLVRPLSLPSSWSTFKNRLESFFSSFLSLLSLRYSSLLSPFISYIWFFPRSSPIYASWLLFPCRWSKNFSVTNNRESWSDQPMGRVNLCHISHTTLFAQLIL